MTGYDLKIGIVSAARVAVYAVIAPARAIAGVEVTAVAARDPERARAYAAKHGIARVHASYGELMNDPAVDLVYIASPPSLHSQQALSAIEAGKPVLVEKPFAMSAAEARAVLNAAQRKGVAVFEAMHSPHHALFRRVQAIAAAGEIGPVRRLDAEFSVPIPRDAEEFRWRPELGGGALMDLGVYPLAWCRRIAGEPTAVITGAATMIDGVDAEFSARLLFAGAVTADVRASMLAPEPKATLRIDGDNGRITVTNPLAPQLGYAFTVQIGSARREETIVGPGTYEGQLSAVRATLIDGAPFPFPPDDFVRSMEAIDLVRAGVR